MRLESLRRSQLSSTHTWLSIGGAVRVSMYAPLELASFSRAKASTCGLPSKRTDTSSEWRTPHRCSIAVLPCLYSIIVPSWRTKPIRVYAYLGKRVCRLEGSDEILDDSSRPGIRTWTTRSTFPS